MVEMILIGSKNECICCLCARFPRHPPAETYALSSHYFCPRAIGTCTMADGTAQSGSEEDDEEYVPQNDADFEKLTTEDALDGDVYLLNGSKTIGQSGAKRKSDQSVANSVIDQIKERKRARRAKEQDATIDAMWASMNQGMILNLIYLQHLNKNMTKKKKKKHSRKKKLKLSNLLRGMSNNNNVARATSMKGNKK